MLRLRVPAAASCAGLRSNVARRVAAWLSRDRAPTQLCCAVVCSCALLCCAVCTCAAFKVSHVPYTTPSVSAHSASSARCAQRCVPCSTVSTVGLPPRCSWHQEMPCLITWCATGPSRAAEGLDGRSTGGTQTPTMRFSPNNSSLRRRCEVRLAVKVAIDEAGAHFAAVFRCDDEAGHQGAEVDAPHRSQPSWSFRIIETKRSPCISSTRIYWCRVWHPAPQQAREKAA